MRELGHPKVAFLPVRWALRLLHRSERDSASFSFKTQHSLFFYVRPFGLVLTFLRKNAGRMLPH